ncbi:hypothetical protein JNB_11444 [Janibacter sp. HTCC2649]|nr:hypothetical protein JNB_11444 [Janibacter sp. HTCC2649]
MDLRLLTPLVMAALSILATSACSGPSEFEYTCFENGRTTTEGPLLDRVTALESTTRTRVADSCDSGDPLTVEFESTDLEKAMDELHAAGCRQRPLDGETEDYGDVVRCPFDFGETEIWVSADPTVGNSAQLVVPD